MLGHLIYPGCPGVSGWMGCLIPGWRWSHDRCWCEVFGHSAVQYWLCPLTPPSRSSLSWRHWCHPRAPFDHIWAMVWSGARGNITI